MARPADFVRDNTGREVHGLSRVRDKTRYRDRFRYFTTHKNKKVWFGFDEADAIHRFRAWEAQQKQLYISLGVGAITEDSDRARLVAAHQPAAHCR